MKRILAIFLALLAITAVFALPMNAADVAYVNDGLVIHYDGANNTGAGQDMNTNTWKDISGNNHDFIIEVDEYNKWTDNALHVDAALFYFPDAALEVINGAAWTVELTLGQIQLLGSSYDTFIFSTNDHFSIFRRTNNDSIEFKGERALRIVFHLETASTSMGNIYIFENGTIAIAEAEFGGVVAIFEVGVDATDALWEAFEKNAHSEKGEYAEDDLVEASTDVAE